VAILMAGSALRREPEERLAPLLNKLQSLRVLDILHRMAILTLGCGVFSCQSKPCLVVIKTGSIDVGDPSAPSEMLLVTGHAR
jgi:hypothetical protein